MRRNKGAPHVALDEKGLIENLSQFMLEWNLEYAIILIDRYVENNPSARNKYFELLYQALTKAEKNPLKQELSEKDQNEFINFKIFAEKYRAFSPETAIIKAMVKKDLKDFEELTKYKFDRDYLDSDSDNLVLNGIYFSLPISLLKILINKGVELSRCNNSYRYNPLSLGAILGDISLLNFLLSNHKEYCIKLIQDDKEGLVLSYLSYAIRNCEIDGERKELRKLFFTIAKLKYPKIKEEEALKKEKLLIAKLILNLCYSDNHEALFSKVKFYRILQSTLDETTLSISEKKHLCDIFKSIGNPQKPLTLNGKKFIIAPSPLLTHSSYFIIEVSDKKSSNQDDLDCIKAYYIDASYSSKEGFGAIELDFKKGYSPTLEELISSINKFKINDEEYPNFEELNLEPNLDSAFVETKQQLRDNCVFKSLMCLIRAVKLINNGFLNDDGEELKAEIAAKGKEEHKKLKAAIITSQVTFLANLVKEKGIFAKEAQEFLKEVILPKAFNKAETLKSEATALNLAEKIFKTLHDCGIMLETPSALILQEAKQLRDLGSILSK